MATGRIDKRIREDWYYRRGSANPAEAAALEILTRRGEPPRQKQNRLLFLAPDFDVVPRLKDQARSYLAWSSIVADTEEMRLVLDTLQVRQAKKQKEDADQALSRSVRDAYRWLLSPVQETRRGRLDPTVRWESVAVSAAAPSLIQEIEGKLLENEWLIAQWSPFHLARILDAWYFREGVTEVNALRVWQDCCHCLYLPRLLDDGVFRQALAAGLESEDFFGYASAKEGESYLGLRFAQMSSPILDASALIIRREAARGYRERIAQKQGLHPTEPKPPIGPVSAGPKPVGPEPASPPTPADTAHHFYGTVALDAVKAKLAFAQIVDEVVQQFTARLGVEVKIAVEIQASSRGGFDESLQRVVKENCNVLKFDSFEFE